MDGLPASFFERQAHSVFRAPRATQGPWDPGAMHGGPVAALLGELLSEAAAPLSPTLRLARLSLDFLGPLPMTELSTTVSVLRPGKRVALLEATLAANGRPAATGRGWFIDSRSAGDEQPIAFASGDDAPSEMPPLASPPPIPGPQPIRYFPGIADFGYGEASEWRFTSGAFAEPGPAGVWSRARVPLFAGEPMTGLSRLLILADAANGASGDLPFGQWVFIPPGLTVTILREPVGEWVHMAARTTLGTDGIGLSYARLSDLDGPVAIASQPLLVSRP